RTGGVIAINLRTDDDGNVDELVSARVLNADEDLLLVSRKGQSLRFTATDEALRPTGRATSGVTGMKFRDDDSLLAMTVVRDDSDLFVVTEGGSVSAPRFRSTGCRAAAVWVSRWLTW